MCNVRVLTSDARTRALSLSRPLPRAPSLFLSFSLSLAFSLSLIGSRGCRPVWGRAPHRRRDQHAPLHPYRQRHTLSHVRRSAAYDPPQPRARFPASRAPWHPCTRAQPPKTTPGRPACPGAPPAPPAQHLLPARGSTMLAANRPCCNRLTHTRHPLQVRRVCRRHRPGGVGFPGLVYPVPRALRHARRPVPAAQPLQHR